jgi:hypothetical protein
MMPDVAESRRHIVPLKPGRIRTLEERKKHGRSRVSNGKDILPDVDGRSLIARRFRDITLAIVNDQGGTGELSEARQQLIRRFAAAAVLAEQLEAKLANGEAIDIAEHALLCSTMVRCARQIGINRIPKDVTPTLEQYIQQKYGSDVEASDA